MPAQSRTSHFVACLGHLAPQQSPVPAAPAWCSSSRSWIGLSGRSMTRCRRSCGKRSCTRSMDLSRQIYRGTTSKTARTRRASTVPWWPMGTLVPSWRGELENQRAQGQRVPLASIGAAATMVNGVTSSRGFECNHHRDIGRRHRRHSYPRPPHSRRMIRSISTKAESRCGISCQERC